MRARSMFGPDCRIAVDHPHAKRAFGFVGKRGAGKTTLMAGVAEALCAAGYTVSAIYCSYAEDGASRRDQEVRLMRDAGCREVIRPEEGKTVPMRGCFGQPEQQLERTLSRMAPVDIVLVEGFEDASLPKLEVFRPSLDVPFVSPCCRCLAALATDANIRYSESRWTSMFRKRWPTSSLPTSVFRLCAGGLQPAAGRAEVGAELLFFVSRTPMQITSRERFAVDALVNLALWGEARPVALARISQRLSVSLSYLEQIFKKLRERGIVASVRGVNGGYTLARSLEELTVAEILHAVGEACRTETGSAVAGWSASNPTTGLWAGVNAVMMNYLLSVSLKDLVDGAQRGHADAFSRP